MEFAEVLRSRHMTRRFRPDAPPDEVLRRVVAAGTRAPTAGFTQGIELLALNDDDRRARFWTLATDAAWRDRGGSARGLLAAPAIVVPVANPSAYATRYAAEDKARSLLGGRPAASWPVPYWLVDAAFAAMLVLLAAIDERLGALFFQLHAPEAAVLSGLGIPADRRLIGAIALGYPEEDQPATSPDRQPKRSADELVHWGQW